MPPIIQVAELRKEFRVARPRRGAHIGAVFGQRNTLWWDLPVRESLDLLRHIYSIPPGRFAANLAGFRTLLEMDDFLETPVRSLSLGQLMRANLAAALIHDPEVLFLDEPTIGLDVVAKERIRQFIRKINRERGTTVILTTHDLGDIEDICNRIVIIDKGKIIHDGDLIALKDNYARDRVIHFQLARPPESVALIRAGLPACETTTDGLRLSVRFDRFKFAAGEIAAAVMPHVEVVDFRIDEPEVEDLIRKVYLGQLSLRAPDAPQTGSPTGA